MLQARLNGRTAPQLSSRRAAVAVRRGNVRMLAAQQATAVWEAPPVPKTGHHTLEDQLVTEALAKFFEQPDKCETKQTSGGVNNVCLYVTTPEQERYILRVYNNGLRTDKVEYEHEVLRQVCAQQNLLSFQVPKAKPDLKDGRPHVKLSNGAEACVFHVIPGGLAKSTTPAEVGRATAELVVAMGNVKMSVPSPTAKYCDLFRAHHKMNRDLFFAEVKDNPELEVCKADLDYLLDEIRAIEPKLVQFEAQSQEDLPRQVIHADLHTDNVLVQDGKVTGLLDFEFCLEDFRAMEMAVALTKAMADEHPLQFITEFCEGYAQGKGSLTRAEIEAMPDFVNLRIFSNVVYFVGRAYSKEDTIDALSTRAGTYARRVKWVNANRQAMIDTITKALSK